MDKKWERINSKILSTNKDFIESPIPFAQNVMIKDFNLLYSKIYDKEKLI